MIKLPSLAVFALMAPAITFGIGSAFAMDPATGAQEQRTAQEQRQMPGQAQKEKGKATADRAKQHAKAHGMYLSSAPANSFRADELIGAKLRSRSDNETIGSISDLVIDENGQIAAVIVEAGGFLGIGQKDVAVSWSSIQRCVNEKGDGFDLSVDTTKDALKDAPEFKAAAD